MAGPEDDHMSEQNPKPVSKVSAAIQTIKAIADTIKELKRVPSGELYARIMSYMTLDQYNEIISILKSTNWIQEKNYELIWIG